MFSHELPPVFGMRDDSIDAHFVNHIVLVIYGYCSIIQIGRMVLEGIGWQPSGSFLFYPVTNHLLN